MDEIDDTVLSGLSEKDLQELSELIDPDVSVCLYLSSYLFALNRK